MSLNFLGLGFSVGVKDDGFTSGIQRVTDTVGDVVHQVQGLTQDVNLTTAYEAHMQALGTSARALGANLGYTGNQLNRFTSRAAGLADGLNVSADVAAQAVDAFARGGEGLRLVGIRSAADATRFQAVFGGIGDLSGTIHQLRTEFQLTDEQIQQVIGSTTAMGRATGNVSGAYQNLGSVLQMLRQQASLQGAELDNNELSSYARQVQALSAGFYQMTHNADEARQMASQVFQAQLGARDNFQQMFAGTSDELGTFLESLSIAQGDVNHAFEQMRQGPAEFVSGLTQMVRQAKRNGPITAEQFNFLARYIERAMPGAGQAVVNFMRSSDDATLEVMSNVQTATADLGRMAREAHRTGRTLQEEFDRVQQIGVAAFRSIGRREAVELVRDTSAEFTRFNAHLRDIVKSGGPMAELVEKLSAVHQIGALALIPRTLRPMAVLFGHVTEQLVPMVTALQALGFRLSSLMNPYAALVAVGGYLLLNFFDLFMQTGSLSAAFEKLGSRVAGFVTEAWATLVHLTDQALTFLDGWSTRAREWAAHFDWKTFFVTWINRALGLARRAGDWFQELGNVVFDELAAIFSGRTASARLGRIVQNLGGVLSSIVEGLAGALGHVDWSTAGRVALMSLFDVMRGPLLTTTVAAVPWGRVAEALSAGLQSATKFLQSGRVGGWLTGLLGSARALVDRWSPVVAEAIRGVAERLPGLLRSGLTRGMGLLGSARALVDRWSPVVAEAIRGVAERLPGLLRSGLTRGMALAGELARFLQGAFDAARGWLLAHRDEISNTLSDLGSRALVALGQGLVWLFRTTSDLGARALAALGRGLVWLFRTTSDLTWEFFARLPSLLGDLGGLVESALQYALTAMGTLTDTLFQTVQRTLTRIFPEYADTINSVMGQVRGFYRFMYDTVYKGIIQGLFQGLRGAFRWTADAIRSLGETASEVAAFVRAPWETLTRWFGRAWEEVRATVAAKLLGVQMVYTSVKEVIATGLTFLRGLFTDTGGTIQGAIGGAITWVETKWEGFRAKVREGIDSISGLLRSVFGGGGEVQQATTATGAAGQAVAQQAQGILLDTTQAVSGGIVSGLVGAFRSGFASVLRGLGEFKDRFIDLFARFGRGLRDKIVEAMDSARSAIEDAITSIEQALTGVERRIASALSVSATLAATSLAIAPAGAVAHGQPAQPVSQVRPLDHATTQEDLRQAVHEPLWYRHYATLFDARMVALTSAVERLARQQPAGGRRTSETGSGDSARVAAGVQTGRAS